MYYAFIENNKINGVGECECLNENVQNIEISEEVFNIIQQDNLRYIWDGENVIENPNYKEEIEEQQKIQRNSEIDSKIKELREMSLIDIMNNNTENIKLYNDVILGLELARPM